MTFRAKLFVLVSLAALAGASLFAWSATRYARREFERFDRQRSDMLAAQFQRELAQRGDEVSSAVQGLADAEGTLRMALDLSRPQADPSVYANDARGLATAHQLDFLDLVGNDSALISSAQWPARSGYRNDWVSAEQGWNQRGAFLQRMELPDGAQLGLLAVRVVRVGEKNLYLIGGRGFDREFLRALALPTGVRALLYRNLETGFAPAALAGVDGPDGPVEPVEQAERFAPLIESAEKRQGPGESAIAWTADPATAERFVTLPLSGRQGQSLGVVLLGSTQRELVRLVSSIRLAALLVAGLGILFALLLSSWASARVTRPLERLAAGARDVAAGRWDTRVAIRAGNEVGQLARAFDEMTKRLCDERVRLVQTERVAAWRDVAGRLTQEVKRALFPLQVTLDNLTRAREQSAERFDEVFFESMAVLRGELHNLKATVARFSEFAKTPAPRYEPVPANDLVRDVVKALEPHFRTIGRPPITPELYLHEGVGNIQADSDLLRKALENLLLHSVDAMPAGGTLTVRTAQANGRIRLEVSGSGADLQPEEAARMFNTCHTVHDHVAGLGLPTTQAIVSDLGGRVIVESAPGTGTTFRLEFPVSAVAAPSASARLQVRRTETKSEMPEDSQVDAETAGASVKFPMGEE